MKKFKIIMVLMLFVFLMPFLSNAEEVTTTSTKDPVKVYFFHGDGCPHCAEAREWFEKAAVQGNRNAKYALEEYYY